MKKTYWWRMLPILGIWLLTGCGAEAPASDSAVEFAAEEVVLAAREALAEADGYEADFEAVVAMANANETQTSGTVTLAEEPLSMLVDIRMAFDDSEEMAYFDEKIYLEESGDAVSQFMNYNGQWTEMTLSPEDAMTGVQVYDTAGNMQIVLEAAENWQLTEKADGRLWMTAVIPEAKVYAVEEAGRLFQLTGMSGLSEVYFGNTGDIPVIFSFAEKTNAPLSYELDLAQALETVTNNVLTELGGGTLTAGVDVERYTITSELTQLGGVDAVTVPEAARSSAINYEREISLLEAAE